MKKIFLLENVMQEYDWGSPLAIPVLMGFENPEKKPIAELWMGVHGRGESIVLDGKDKIPLSKFIKADTEFALGKKITDKFSTLPFLYKVLGIESPLSLQVHPTKAMAKKGFSRENSKGIAIDAPNRNYRDSNHKPEIICALSDEFWGMKGFRPIHDIINEFEEADFPMLRKDLEAFKSNATSEGLELFWLAIMNIDGKRASTLTKEAFDYASGKEENFNYKWVKQLYEKYPDDVGVLSALYLNVVRLTEGEALFLEAGELHAYLQGLGMELMANSDNVLRGGLTPKFIDVEELRKNLVFESSKVEKLFAEGSDGHYDTPTDEFKLSKMIIEEDRFINAKNPPSILFCTKGKIRLETVKGNEDAKGHSFSVVLKRGESAFMPFAAGGYITSGKGEIFIASIPI